jgi:hypothetical protein
MANFPEYSRKLAISAFSLFSRRINTPIGFGKIGPAAGTIALNRGI